jgi:hypothetical protein
LPDVVILTYVVYPPSPRRLEDTPTEGKGKAKERCEVSEGDDTVTIEDTSDDEDEETLQERFQLRCRFNRAGMSNIPVIVEKPASLEASIPVPPRRPHNATRKRTANKLKITETTNQEVGTTNGVVEYFPMSTVF